MKKPFRYIDLHMDVASALMVGDDSQITLAEIKTRVEFFLASIFVETAAGGESVAVAKVKKQFLWYEKTAADQNWRQILKKADLQEKSSNPSFLLHLEGLDFLGEKNFSLLEKLAGRGLRSAGIIWNNVNALGSPAASANPDAGLTAFGRRIVKKLDALGLLLDCAHLNRGGFYDVLRFASRPPFVSHANASALCPERRNLDDRQIRELARAGGLLGVFFSGRFVRARRRPTVEDVAAHLEHLVQVGGVDLVAIGSDFGGITSGLVQGLAAVSDIENLKTALQERGWGQKDLEKIFWQNALRYLKANLPT